MSPAAPNVLRDRRVRVEVGIKSRPPRAEAPADVCVVAIVPPGQSWLADRFPGALVRETRFRDRNGAVEQLRFTSTRSVGRLPGLDPVVPTRLRDAVTLALRSGAPAVEVLAIRMRGVPPWALDDPRVVPLLDSFLDDLPGALVVLPDAGGPWETGPRARATVESRRDRLVRAVHAFAPGWRERYQIGLFDLPPDDPMTDTELFRLLDRVDASPCIWAGAPQDIAAHGWRVASAAVAGALQQGDQSVVSPLAGRDIHLGPGRRIRPDKGATLGRPPKARLVPPDRSAHAIEVRLRGDDEARVVTEPTLRQPAGSWSLPALRSAKALHHAIIRAADPFVFRPVDDAEALRLVIGLDQVVRPFAEEGILVGPDGAGAPQIDASVDKGPTTPGFVATIAAQLRPWAREIRVRVRIDPGGRPRLEGGT